jgi:hypothetical protein
MAKGALRPEDAAVSRTAMIPFTFIIVLIKELRQCVLELPWIAI